jgi:hypothetical protein
MPKKKTIAERIAYEEEYIVFLKKRLDSKNYKANVSKEEYAETKAKYDKVKLVLKVLKSS